MAKRRTSRNASHRITNQKAPGRARRLSSLIGSVVVIALNTFASTPLQEPPLPATSTSQQAATDSTPEATDSASAVVDVPSTWNEAAAPQYTLVQERAQADTSLSPGEVIYDGVDQLGRTKAVRTCITESMARNGSARERDNISAIHPSGWPQDNPRVFITLPNGHIYHGELYNSSHLLAKSLGGKDALENLVAGTRMQNFGANDDNGGMAYAESRTRNWLASHPDGHLYYDATPHYEGSELLCRYVIVDMKSSDGSLDERVIVYNAAKGFEIDYTTGAWRKQTE